MQLIWQNDDPSLSFVKVEQKYDRIPTGDSVGRMLAAHRDGKLVMQNQLENTCCVTNVHLIVIHVMVCTAFHKIVFSFINFAKNPAQYVVILCVLQSVFLSVVMMDTVVPQCNTEQKGRRYCSFGSLDVQMDLEI